MEIDSPLLYITADQNGALHSIAKMASYNHIQVEVKAFNNKDSCVLHKLAMLTCDLKPGSTHKFEINLVPPMPNTHLKYRVIGALAYQLLPSPDIEGLLKPDSIQVQNPAHK